MKKSLLLIVVTCLMTISHYGQDKTSSNLSLEDDIYNTKWILQSASNQKVIERIMTLFIDKGGFHIIGDTGCNSFEIPIKNISQSKGKVTITTFAGSRTDNRCTHIVNTSEELFVNNLSKTSFKVHMQSNDSLFLTTRQGITMLFSKEKENPLLRYIGKHDWKLIQMRGDSSRVYHPYFSLDFENNRISGSTGCGTFEGEFTINDNQDTISFKQLAVKVSSCINDRDKVAKDFINILQNKSYLFDVADQTLNLYQDDKIILMFGIIQSGLLQKANEQ